MDNISISGPFVRKIVEKLFVRYFRKKLGFNGDFAVHELSIYQDETNDKNLVLYATVGASINKNQLFDILTKNHVI